jgi:hypothetical protein
LKGGPIWGEGETVVVIRQAADAIRALSSVPAGNAESRDAVIEECARVADNHPTCRGKTIAEAIRVLKSAPASRGEVMSRDDLGRLVREAWVRWALTQPSPKPSWLVPYDELSEPDKEADRQIGAALRAALTLQDTK